MYFTSFKTVLLDAKPFEENNYAVLESGTPAVNNWIDASSALSSKTDFGNCSNFA